MKLIAAIFFSPRPRRRPLHQRRRLHGVGHAGRRAVAIPDLSHLCPDAANPSITRPGDGSRRRARRRQLLPHGHRFRLPRRRLEDTIVISPRFASNAGGCNDKLAPNEVNWSCNGDSWRSGGTSGSNQKLTSYDLTDEILRKLANKEIFPNLKAIVVAGHSAGGQYVNRYEMSNQVHDSLGVPVTYVVSNPPAMRI
jgi:hypothetical protein